MWMGNSTQGETNSVAYMVNVIIKVIRDCIISVTLPFLEEILIKECFKAEQGKTLDENGCMLITVI